MKNVMLAFIAIVCMSSCEAQSTTDPDSNVVAQDPKCLVRTQWDMDKSFALPFPASYWFIPPTMNFNTETEGFFEVGMGIGKFKNNTINHLFEVHFLYSVKIDKVVFEIKSVKKFAGLGAKLSDETGQDAINTAKELMNFVNLDNGIKFTCSGQKLTFSSTEPVTRVPFKMYNWIRSN
jgi:hypothetical protein